MTKSEIRFVIKVVDYLDKMIFRNKKLNFKVSPQFFLTKTIYLEKNAFA